MDERKSPEEESYPATSDNQYQGDVPRQFTARQVARWVGITPTRVRQLSQLHNIGQKVENYWKYSFNDIRLIGNTTRKGRLPMRNITPPSDPELILRQLEGQDQLKKYMAAAWRQLHSDLRMFLGDVSQGLFHRLDKVHQAIDRQHAADYTNLMTMYQLLSKRVEQLEKRKENGRGVLSLASGAPLTLVSYEAEAA